MGMAIVHVTPFFFLTELYIDLFIHPRLHCYLGIGLVIPLKYSPFFGLLITRMLLIILHQKGDHFQRLIFHALNIKIYFCTNLMLRGLVGLRGIYIGVMHRTAMAAGNNHAPRGLGLQIIQQLNQDRIHVLFTLNDRQSMPPSIAIGCRNRFPAVPHLDHRWIERTASTSKIFLGDSGQMGFGFPWIRRSRGMIGIGNGTKMIILIAIYVFGFAVLSPNLLLF